MALRGRISGCKIFTSVNYNFYFRNLFSLPKPFNFYFPLFFYFHKRFFYFRLFFTSNFFFYFHKLFFTYNCSFTSIFLFYFHKPLLLPTFFLLPQTVFFYFDLWDLYQCQFFPKFTTLLRFSCHPIFPNVGIYSKRFDRELKTPTNAPPPKITLSPTQWSNTKTKVLREMPSP